MTVTKFRPSFTSLILNLAGLFLFVLSIIVLYGIVITLRNPAFYFLGMQFVFLEIEVNLTVYQLGLLLIFLELLLIPIVTWIFGRYQSKTLMISDEGIRVRNLFTRNSKYIPWEELRFVEVQDKTNFINGLLGPFYNIMILSLGDRINIKSRMFARSDELIRYFLNHEREYNDEFIKFFFYRGRGSVFKRLIRDPAGLLSLLGMSIVFFVYVWGALAQFIYPSLPPRLVEGFGLKNPEYQYAFDKNYYSLAVDSKPNAEFPLGTDFIGRDYFSRTIYGTFFSLNILVFFSMVVVVLGTFFGILSGYVGGKIDQLILSLSDMAIAVPAFAIWVLGASLTTPLRLTFIGGVFMQIFAFATIFAWASPARIIREEVRSLKKQEYIDAEKVYGASSFRILFKHIFPNLVPVIATVFITVFVDFTMAMITMAIIIGAENEIVWGSDISRRLNPDYYTQTLDDPYVLFTILYYSIFILSVMVFGDTLKDALDPRYSLKKTKKAKLKKTSDKISVKLKKKKSEEQTYIENLISKHFDGESPPEDKQSDDAGGNVK